MKVSALAGEMGKFIAPGCECGVLSLEISKNYHDLGGQVRLDRRPYWEGRAVPVKIEMPEAPGRIAMNFTALMVERSDWDGEGCDVVLADVELEPCAPAMSLDEQTHGEAIDWGEVRSACAARDWRRAWETVGVDHEGAATPGEVYLFGVAKGVRAVSAALFHWRSERRSEIDKRMMARIRHKQAKAQGPHGVAPLPDYVASWARIKNIAAWESSAAAQHVSKVKLTMGVDMVFGRDFSAVVNGVEVTYFDESSRFTREAFERMTETLRASELRIPSSVQHDARAVLDDLIAMRAMDRPVVALPSDMQMRWIDHEGSPLEDLRQAMGRRAPMSGTLTMHEDVARALADHPILRPLTQANAERAGLNPAPRGPAQRKRRAR